MDASYRSMSRKPFPWCRLRETPPPCAAGETEGQRLVSHVQEASLSGVERDAYPLVPRLGVGQHVTPRDTSMSPALRALGCELLSRSSSTEHVLAPSR